MVTLPALGSGGNSFRMRLDEPLPRALRTALFRFCAMSRARSAVIGFQSSVSLMTPPSFPFSLWCGNKGAVSHVAREGITVGKS